MRGKTSEGRIYVDGPRPERPWQVRLGFWLLLAIGAYYLLTEHRAHVALGIPYLPWLLLAACPLIHLFGHGHGGHGSHQSPPKPKGTDALGSGRVENTAESPHRHGGEP